VVDQLSSYLLAGLVPPPPQPLILTCDASILVTSVGALILSPPPQPQESKLTANKVRAIRMGSP
jgi:hypothetical protein